MRSLAVALVAAVTALAGSLTAPAPIFAASIDVTTTADEVIDDGECSLREAVIAANTNVAVDTCPAGSASENDGIFLAPGHYRLTIAGAGEDDAATGDLDIRGDLSIDGGMVANRITGSPNDTVIDGGGLDRVLDIHEGVRRVGLNWLVVSGGSAPGNDGGGIRTTGSDPLPDDSCADARLNISNAVVRDNTAARGGGIFVDTCAQLDAEWAALADNVASGDGGGVASAALAHLRFVGATVSGNSAGGAGGGIWSEGPTSGGLFWSTVAENAASDGGGLWQGPPPPSRFALNSTILAHNSGGNCTMPAPRVDAILFNLSSDASCVVAGAGNLPSTDPHLLPRVADPVAYRVAPGSPAIDAGQPESNCELGDAFGSARPLDGDGDGMAVCDIGAYEAPGAPASPAPSPSMGGGLPNTAVALSPEDVPGRGLELIGLLVVGLAASLSMRFAQVLKKRG